MDYERASTELRQSVQLHSLLVFDWGDDTDETERVVVEPPDPFERGEPDVFETTHGPGFRMTSVLISPMIDLAGAVT